jgi:CubicO group peptidase (beta-lactamase class C family)
VSSFPFPVEGFSGVVRIGDEARAFGDADRAHAVPNTVDTQFAIASGTKGFTAIVAVEALPLDLRARELLGDDVPLVDERVTVEHLLRHTSGIGDYLDEELHDDWDEYLMPVSGRSSASRPE